MDAIREIRARRAHVAAGFSARETPKLLGTGVPGVQ
jgi:hypothetical protein